MRVRDEEEDKELKDRFRNHADASARLRIKKLPGWIDIYGVKRVEVARTRGDRAGGDGSAVEDREYTHESYGNKSPMPVGIKIKEESRKFIKKILPAIKGRRSYATGLIEAISSLPSTAFLIFISDITANTSELIKIFTGIKEGVLA